MNKLIITLGIIIFIHLSPVFAQKPVSKINPILQNQLIQQPGYRGQNPYLSGLKSISTQGLYPVIIRTTASREKLVKAGYPVQSMSGNMATMSLTTGQIQSLSQRTDVTGIEGSVYRPPLLDISTQGSVTTVSGSTVYYGIDARWLHSLGTTGKGVIIGDVDTGIDPFHKDFQSTATTTRILYIWDQTDNTTGNHPFGYNYGREYSRESINYQLSNPSANIIFESDPQDHGTHVMGIAAGNGFDAGYGGVTGTYAGVAPEADIIMVKTDFIDTHILDGAQYVFSKASSLHKPAVLNLSIGSENGPHDGTDSFESFLNSLSGPGRIIAVAAGNDGNSQYHAEGTLATGAEDTLSFNLYSSDPYIEIDLWHDGHDSFTSKILAPYGTYQITSAYSNSSSIVGGGLGLTYNHTFTTANGDGEIYLTVSQLTLFGTWQLILNRDTTSTGTGHYHAWVCTPSTYFLDHFTHQYLVTEPGNTKTAITVGSFISRNQWYALEGTTHFLTGINLGDISSFSGIGPSKDGTRKPDITAPGQIIASSMAYNSIYTSYDYMMTDGRHRLGQGTSFAAPHVAGAIALILQSQPNYTPDTIKSLLQSWGTQSDIYTGSLPDSGYRWGYGKLNLRQLFSGHLPLPASSSLFPE